jgi:cytochrome c-type biogenesis protein CcmH/NrfG
MEESLLIFQEALAREPALPEAYLGLARIAWTLGHAEKATQELKNALKYDPYYREALQLLHEIRSPAGEGVEPHAQSAWNF